MKKIILSLAAFLCLNPLYAYSQDITVWRSTEDAKYQLTETNTLKWQSMDEKKSDVPFIQVNPEETYQTILGFGASFEHASCYNLSQLDETTREDTIRKIVHPQEGIGMNLMRICIGTSDFVGEPFYTYNDLPEGETDIELEHFSIEKDREYVIPILKTALEINPELRFYASPWSPPAWMKTNGSLKAGKMKPEYYDVYARYLLKYIEAYEQEGIPIYAITTQNEPNYPNPEYPTCHWTAEEQLIFIRDHLGPLFQEKGIKTEIWCWDHNWNLVEFPRIILSDPIAYKFVDGTAFHLYEGEVEAQTVLHNEFPDKPLYFTEGSVFFTPGAIEIIEILRNWSRSYNAWVIMLDEHQKPNNGPHHADPTPIERLDDNSTRYNYDYYMYGQFMKFIHRNAQRIDSTSHEDIKLANIAFRNPDGKIVCVIANNHEESKTLQVQYNDQLFHDTLDAKSVATYQWSE